MKIYKIKERFLLLICLAVILCGFSQASSQSIDRLTDEIPPPNKESFRSSTDLIVPYRAGSCLSLTLGRQNGSGCYTVPAVEFQSRTRITLYSADSKVWHTLDLNLKSDIYFGKLPKEEFVPFSTPGLKSVPPMSLVLRINGESDHWYRVIVNEDSGSVAYVLKLDPDWTKTTYDYWLRGRKALFLTAEQPPLLDAPNGKAIPESEFIKFDKVEYLRLDKPDGEWAFVEGWVNLKSYRGWLRWRDGRKFLVDCYFALKDPGW